jgi:hypothetical protein
VQGGEAVQRNHEALRAMVRIGGAEGRTLISVEEIGAALDLNEHDTADLIERLGNLGLVWIVRGSRRVAGRGGLNPMAAVLSDAGRAALGGDGPERR